MTRPDARELAVMLADDIEAVVERLAIDVKRRGRGVLYCLSPWSDSAKPKLEIEVYPIAGKWNDWSSGRCGDAYDLVAYVEGAGERDRSAAFKWAREYFAIDFERDPGAVSAWLQKKREAEARAKGRAQKAAEDLARARAAAASIFFAAHDMRPGHAGWDYLAARGIDFKALGRIPRAVKFDHLQPYYDVVTGEETHVGPALVTMMTLPDGRPGCIHRTWIDPHRPGQKADVEKPRKMWPSSEGAAMRLWRGASGLSSAKAAEAGVREDGAVCEGLEDGLSIAMMTPELRVEAAGSLPGLLSYVPPPSLKLLVVAEDNDWGKPQAQAMLDKACARFRTEFKLPVHRARSPEGKDFNDLLRGVA